jgi:hypothetical protein
MRYCFAVALVLLWTSAAFAQHGLGSRHQWQPQITEGGFDPDRRLEQTVRLDILGRSAISTLGILSKQTGISFRVAPENFDTVGQRKLSLFAFRPTRLKEILVQIPEALQECHWDIDKSGNRPVYYLHRNSGADQLREQLTQEARLRRRDEKQAGMTVRLEAARRALAMSPQELAAVETSDFILTRCVRDPVRRGLLEVSKCPKTNLRHPGGQ